MDKCNETVLSDRDRDLFLAILNKDTPSEALQNALDTRKEIMNEREHKISDELS